MPPNEFTHMRPGSTTSHKPDLPLNADAREAGEASLADTTLKDRMIRRPTEEDFAEVLNPEGDTGVVGSDISDSTIASNASIGGT